MASTLAHFRPRVIFPLVIRGAGFIETIASTSERDPSYGGLLAGVLVLRAVDYARRRRVADQREIISARERVSYLADLPLRTRLLHILRHIQPDDVAWPDPLDESLVAYGSELHALGFFAPAIDVFSIVCEAYDADQDLKMRAILNRAFSARCAQRFAEALMGYDLLERVASYSADLRMSLEADLGRAKVAADRGDMAAADEQLAIVVAKAERRGERAVLAKAQIDRARLAGIAGRPADALRYARAAIPHLEKRIDIDRALKNVSVALRELGRAASARDVARRVAISSEEAGTRTAGWLLLYHLAIDERNLKDIGECRAHLDPDCMVPMLRAEYWEAEARWHASVGDFLSASRDLDHMIGVASSAGLGELESRAGRALTDVRNEIVPALYEYRPIELEAAQRETVRAMELAIVALCAA